MAGIKRRMKRYHVKVPDFHVIAWCQDGDLFLIVCAGSLISGTGVIGIGLPDCNLPWLADKVIARIEQSSCKNQEEALDIADQTIAESKPALLAMACPCNEIPVGKRQCVVLH